MTKARKTNKPSIRTRLEYDLDIVVIRDKI